MTTTSKRKPSTKSDQPHEYVELPPNIGDLFAAAQEATKSDKLNDFEREFVAGNSKRYEQWGEELHLTAKQLARLRLCAAKLEPEGEDLPDPNEVTE